jgi:hypothetical protein
MKKPFLGWAVTSAGFVFIIYSFWVSGWLILRLFLTGVTLLIYAGFIYGWLD